MGVHAIKGVYMQVRIMRVHTHTSSICMAHKISSKEKKETNSYFGW